MPFDCRFAFLNIKIDFLLKRDDVQMLQFFLGVLVGGIIGFAAFCAICCADVNDDYMKSYSKKESDDTEDSEEKQV